MRDPAAAAIAEPRSLAPALSGYKPSNLKKGKAALVGLNEAQQIRSESYRNARGATVDAGGFSIWRGDPVGGFAAGGVPPTIWPTMEVLAVDRARAAVRDSVVRDVAALGSTFGYLPEPQRELAAPAPPAGSKRQGGERQ
ncbi:MAG TPA: hypothetical protein VF516_32755, partial [Kofleriaceae bacterium]